MVEWAQSKDPGIRYVLDLQLLLRADGLVRKEFLTSGCGKEVIYSGADRLMNPSYRPLAERTGSIIREHISHWSAEERLTYDEFVLALLFAYRKADQASKREWLVYMRTPDASLGRDSLAKLQAIQEFGLTGYDIPSGRYHTGWLRWLAEYLQKGGMSDAFVKAAGKTDPRFGELFALDPSKLVPSSPKDRGAFEALSNELAAKLDEIAGAMLEHFPDVRFREALVRWYQHPIAKQVPDVYEKIRDIRLHASGDPKLPAFPRPLDPEVQAFLKEIEDGIPSPLERGNEILPRVKKLVDGRCADLRPAG